MSVALAGSLPYGITRSIRPRLRELLGLSRYLGYAYAYPHKTAYRPLAAPEPLEQVWRDDRARPLFLYVHVPFCEARCGFCNLFADRACEPSIATEWLAAIERQVRALAPLFAGSRFDQIAVGGGTPTWLPVAVLAALLDRIGSAFEVAIGSRPSSIETSPTTATEEHLRLLESAGFSRVSIGVQSLSNQTLRALGRRGDRRDILIALERLRRHGFPTLNVDLVYGAPGQTPAGLLEDVREVLSFRPEEIYLYPLYVRPGTGLGRRGLRWLDERPALYRAARDRLRSDGYRQISMRMFRRADAAPERSTSYRCQDDGMVGIGCGARSYTQALHYAEPWAVDAAGVRRHLGRWMARPEEAHRAATHGYVMDEEDRRRRACLQSLLQFDGLDRAGWARTFGDDCLVHLPELRELWELGLAEDRADRIVLTDEGMACSDVLGIWLASERARTRSAEFGLP